VPEPSAVIRISARGLRKTEQMARLNERDIRREIQFMIEALGEGAVNQLRARAPERTGRLRAGIRVVGQNRQVYKPSITVGVDVASDQGFPYLNVTRFGRRAVVSKRPARPARTYTHPGKPGDRGFQNRPFRKGMLRFEPGPPGSGFIYRRRVRAYHPGRDWVKSAEDGIQGMSDRAWQDITSAVEQILRRDAGRPIASRARRVTVQRTSRTGRFY
jgi:hypothetical protein